MDGQINAHQHVEDVPLDFVDPHRAALESNPEHSEIPSLSTLLAVVSLALAYICPISCGFSLATGILISIGTALGDTTNITWLVGGWSIASSVSFSMAGGLSDVFGRRWTIISGQIFCIIGSIVAATAKNVSTIIVASTFLGFGCGIIFVSYAGISELLPNKWRATGLALTELAINIPFNIANVIIATELNLHTALAWRWCYWIGLMFAVVSTAGTLLFYFPPSRPQFDHEKTRWEEVKQLDVIGLTTFLIGLTWAGQTNHPWRSVSVIAPIVIGFCVLAACFAYDFTLAKRPLFPLEVFRKVRDFTVLLGIVFVAGMIYFSMSALLPQGSLYIFTSDPIQIGLIALPNGIVRFIFGAVATSFMGKIKHLKVQILVGLGIQAIFTACLAAIIPQNKIAWSALQAFAVGPFALVVLACYVIARLNVPLRYLGLASGLIGTFRSMGGSVGNAIFNAVLQGVTSKDLGPAIASAAIGQGFNATELGLLIPATVEAVVGVPDAFAGVPGATQAVQTAAILAFRQVYARAFQMVFFSTIPFGVMAVILACFIRDPSIYLTNHTAIHMERDGVFNKGAVQGHHDGHMLGKAEADADNKVVHAGKS
ncbi:putative major facilitator superfamily transporter [Exophiala viscosa]|uniref:Major facilitator superfamily transporter n=1 Tax=Exophiala viscosa TaxID=2486360 RepID=A0AAN6IDV6_9EURO|nr:putative major facilitator superfamily transporter [Exophiala viscosa]